MMDETSRDQVLVIAAEGSRVRRAIERLDEAGTAIAGAVRRAMPFVGRSALPVVIKPATAAPMETSIASLAKPMHQTAITIEPGGSAGVLAFDGAAVAMVLDGLLGGDGKNPAALKNDKLTTTQAALMTRVAAGLCSSLSEALGKLGLTLAPRAKGAPEPHGETAPITCAVEIGEGAHVGRILLVIAKDALAQKTTDAAPAKAAASLDARIVSTVEQIEVELVAELGHARMRLADLAALAPGATLRLDAPISGSVGVMAQGQALFSGRPTAVNGVIAVRLDRHEG